MCFMFTEVNVYAEETKQPSGTTINVSNVSIYILDWVFYNCTETTGVNHWFFIFNLSVVINFFLMKGVNHVNYGDYVSNFQNIY